jgi:hypothetical protein
MTNIYLFPILIGLSVIICGWIDYIILKKQEKNLSVVISKFVIYIGIALFTIGAGIEDHRQASLQSVTISLDNIKIDSLLDYDKELTNSNTALNKKVDSLSISNLQIQHKLDELKLEIANSGYKINSKGQVVPINLPVSEFNSNSSANKKHGVQKQNTNELTNYYQGKISSFLQETKKYNSILSKDSVTYKAVSTRSILKMRNDEKIADQVQAARIQLWEDGLFAKRASDSLHYYQAQLKSISGR